MRLFGCGFVTFSDRSRWLRPSKVPYLAQKSVILILKKLIQTASKGSFCLAGDYWKFYFLKKKDENSPLRENSKRPSVEAMGVFIFLYPHHLSTLVGRH